MPVSSEKYYKPEEALQDLQVQETILNVAVDVQVLLRILVDKEVITREEVAEYRKEVRNSPKYKVVADDIQRQKTGFQAAKDKQYLKLKWMEKLIKKG